MCAMPNCAQCDGWLQIVLIDVLNLGHLVAAVSRALAAVVRAAWRCCCGARTDGDAHGGGDDDDEINPPWTTQKAEVRGGIVETTLRSTDRRFATV